jgi:hypothetical protein
MCASLQSVGKLLSEGDYHSLNAHGVHIPTHERGHTPSRLAAGRGQSWQGEGSGGGEKGFVAGSHVCFHKAKQIPYDVLQKRHEIQTWKSNAI